MVDDIFFVGNWQLEGFCEKLGWSRDRAWVVPNGVVPEYYNTEDHFFRGKRMFYSSTPFRGLKHLINIYPKIKERVRGAELHIYGGMGVYQDHNSDYDKVYREFEDMDGVVVHGPLGQRDLATEMQKSRILAYPNTFPETCCTTALEAMAAGNLVITSWRAGLIDTAGYNGILIPGEPGTPEYDNNFVEECVHYLENDAAWGLYARKAWSHTLNNCSWDRRVNTWLDNLDLIKLRG
jgi:glycosyltransferase involved in cell wall biosynthesis